MRDVGAVTPFAVTVNVAEVAPGATVTLAGTAAAEGFEMESDIVAPPEGAGAVSVSVPVPVCPLVIAPGPTATLLSAAGAGGAGLTVILAALLTPE